MAERRLGADVLERRDDLVDAWQRETPQQHGARRECLAGRPIEDAVGKKIGHWRLRGVYGFGNEIGVRRRSMIGAERPDAVGGVIGAAAREAAAPG